MKRRHLIEIEDQSWCPCTIRDAVTDYLQFVLSATKPYIPIVPILGRALERAGTRHVLDLCSGGAGPWLWLQPALADLGVPVTVCLSDKYPNIAAFERSRRASNGAITFHSHPVDATGVSDELPVFWTMFTAFHHFTPGQGRAALADAVLHRQGIGIFEATERSWLALLLMLLAPLAVLVVTPWIRPFRWSRLLWTYLIPIVPLVTIFDGLVSCLRTYSVPELRELTAGLGESDYRWEVGAVKSGRSLTPITYVIGIPGSDANPQAASRSVRPKQE